MHSYLPNTENDRKAMLTKIGVNDVDTLFRDIPEKLRLNKPLDLLPAMSEYETDCELKSLAAKNASAVDNICFMGGGVYDHYIPAAIGQLLSREEFYTAYTPYQAEMSQGTLQSIFEFQTLISRLCGMDIANASVYDGATACAEAMFMATNTNDRNEIVILSSVNNEYTETCRTYARFRDITIKISGHDKKTGRCDIENLHDIIFENTSAVIIQSPNYFGIVEDIAAIAPVVKEKGAVLIVAADPISLGLLKPPGELGADIVVGEGQSLGNPMSFGGPGLGFLSCKSEFLRKLPGRIAGETTDKDSNRGFVLTMQAREQHIRREKATSNICSNQALCSLTACIYMTLMGKRGMRDVAELCVNKARYTYDALINSGRFEAVYSGTFFKEFTVRYKGDTDKLLNYLHDGGFLPGIKLSGTSLDNCLLIAVTEKRTKRQIDSFIEKAVSFNG